MEQECSFYELRSCSLLKPATVIVGVCTREVNMSSDGLESIRNKLEQARELGLNPEEHGIEKTVEAIDSISLCNDTESFNRDRLFLTDPNFLRRMDEAVERGELAIYFPLEAAAHPVLKLAVAELLDQQFGPVFIEDAGVAAETALAFYKDAVLRHAREYLSTAPGQLVATFGSPPADTYIDLELLLEMVDSGFLSAECLSSTMSDPHQYQLTMRDWLKGKRDQ